MAMLKRHWNVFYEMHDLEDLWMARRKRGNCEIENWRRSEQVNSKLKIEHINLINREIQ